MTRDERSALYTLVRQFAPDLTQGLDDTHLDDERTLALVGEAMAQMHASGLYGDEPAPFSVPPARLEALLRAHRILFNDTHTEPYTDDAGRARQRYRVVPRPATASDVLGHRATPDGVRVVLSDGTRHLLDQAVVAL